MAGLTVSFVLSGCGGKEKPVADTPAVVEEKTADVALKDDMLQSDETVVPMETAEPMPDKANFSESLFYCLKQSAEHK